MPLQNLLGGLSLEEKQLPDNHRVVVSNQPIPEYDELFISYNVDNTVHTKVYQLLGVTKLTITYNYSGGNLVSKVKS